MKQITKVAGIILTALLASTTSYSNEGADGSGGGFVTFYSKKILDRAAMNLLQQLEVSKATVLVNEESRRKVAIEALEDIQIHPSEARTRNGVELFMDFDRPAGRIVILKPFFQQFAVSAATPENIGMVSLALMHEVTHLWGIEDDNQAEETAQNILNSEVESKLSKDVSKTCENFSTLAISKYEPKILKDYFSSLRDRYCRDGRLFTKAPRPASDRELARKLSSEMANFRFAHWGDLSKMSRTSIEGLEWDLLN